RRCGNMDGALFGFEFLASPRFETDRIAAEPASSDRRREGRAHAREKGAAAMVEIVEMLIVAQQDRVHRADLLDCERWPCQLIQSQADLIEAGRVECRIGEETQPGKFDQNGRAAD